MKIPLWCSECVFEDINSGQFFAFVEFNDDGVYKAECPKGHKTTTILQHEKFELLFDIGAYAIADGYYREAITSFTAALERFYEYYIKIICNSKGINQETFQNSWKKVQAQTERQFGAYIFVYLLENKSMPNLLSDSNIKFRNDVVHKGKIPTKQEALKYGQDILDLIRPILTILKRDFRQKIDTITLQNKLNVTNYRANRSWIPTILTLNECPDPSLEKRTLVEAISQLHYF